MAYNGNSSKIVSSSFLFTTLQSFYTKIKGLLDTKADKTALSSINPNTIASGYTKNPFYINTHPENSGAIIPFVNNDIAYLLKRGGSAIVYYDGVVQSADISNVFDGSASYWNISVSDITEVIIELTLHKTFTYTNVAYIDFGATHWRAKNIMIDVMNSNSETEWTNKSTITENSIGEHKITFTHNDGTGFNKIRFTFSNFAYTSFRIACLGLIGYNSNGLRETFLPKDGGSVYGAITPYSNNSIDVGSSNLRWKNVYATTFNGNLSGNASTATTATTATKATTLDGLTSTVTELNYCDGVTSNIQTQLNNKANSSHAHNYLDIKDSNTITSTTDDTTAKWGEHKTSIHWYDTSGQLTDQPSTYGYLLNVGRDSEVHQLWLTQTSGDIKHRGGNGSGWSGTWRTMLDSSNYKTYITPSNIGAAVSSHTHSYLPLTGGTLTGGLVLSSSNSVRARHFDGSTDGFNGELYLNYNNPNAVIHLGNAGQYISNNGSYYTGTAAKADTVDGFHASANVGYYLRPISYGTSGLTAGTSSLTTGYIYIQYE